MNFGLSRGLIVGMLWLAAAGGEAGDWAILPLAQAELATMQCSRVSPQHGQPFWLPAETQVRQLEAKLPQFLKASKHWNPAIDLHAFKRQYVGFTRGGRKLIYLNAFDATLPAQMNEGCRDRTPKERAKMDACSGPDYWRRLAVMACDGGDLFWGLEYDPASGSFAELHFNGGV